MPAVSKFSPALAEQIVASVRAGNFRTTAAGAAGIDQKTLREWVHKGDKQRDGHPLKEFGKALRKAEKHAQATMVMRINKAGAEDWKAIAWILERLNPRKYGLKVRVEVEREMDEMLGKLQRHLPPAEYERALHALSMDDEALVVHALPPGPGSTRSADDGDEYLDAE